MKLIDTSAWIEFFRPQGRAPVKQRVARQIQLNAAAYTCPVYFELLCGAKPREMADLEKALSFCERIYFEARDWAEAATVERTLRAHGLTIPRNDIFVATVALRTRLPVIGMDEHFNLMRDTGGLALQLE